MQQTWEWEGWIWRKRYQRREIMRERLRKNKNRSEREGHSFLCVLDEPSLLFEAVMVCIQHSTTHTLRRVILEKYVEASVISCLHVSLLKFGINICDVCVRICVRSPSRKSLLPMTRPTWDLCLQNSADFHKILIKAWHIPHPLHVC